MGQGYNRRELFAMFARFKALCALGSNPGAVGAFRCSRLWWCQVAIATARDNTCDAVGDMRTEKHVFRRMPMLFVEDEAFTDRVFRVGARVG